MPALGAVGPRSSTYTLVPCCSRQSSADHSPQSHWRPRRPRAPCDRASLVFLSVLLSPWAGTHTHARASGSDPLVLAPPRACLPGGRSAPSPALQVPWEAAARSSPGNLFLLEALTAPPRQSCSRSQRAAPAGLSAWRGVRGGREVCGALTIKVLFPLGVSCCVAAATGGLARLATLTPRCCCSKPS